MASESMRGNRFIQLHYLQGMPVDAVVPAGNDPSPELLEWMRQFAIAKQRPFFW